MATERYSSQLDPTLENIATRLPLAFGAKTTFHQRLRPYHVEYTGSRPITEVKQRRAWLVLGWVTAWEYQVL